MISLASLVLVFSTITLYQLVQYVIHSTKFKKEPKNEEDATDEKTGKYLPKTYNLKEVPILKAVQDVLDKPLSKTDLYPRQEAPSRLLASGNIKDVPFGWAFDDDNILQIHCNTIFKNAQVNMMSWWFKNMCRGKGKYHWYKWWHPVDHFKAWYAEDEIHPNDDKSNINELYSYVGHNKYVYEYICKEKGVPMDFIKISFVSPKEFGFDDDTINDKNKHIVCIKVGVMNFQAYIGHLVHYCENINNNKDFIMKSRFWIGEASLFNSVPYPLKGIIELLYKFKFVRKLMIPPDQGQRTLLHCTREMNCLAGFLPELYQLYHKE